MGIMLATEANNGIYENADDVETKYREIPMCCSDIIGCAYSIGNYSIIDDGGRDVQEDPVEVEVIWSKR
jgi:hypothetical protein